MRRTKILALMAALLVVFALSFAVSAEEVQNGWVQNSDQSWSYYQDGSMYTDGVYNIGGVYYGFDWDGIMYAGEFFDSWVDNGDGSGSWKWFYANADGVLYANTWFTDGMYWYYAGADASLYSDGVYNIGGQYYAFRPGASMYNNEKFKLWVDNGDGSGSWKWFYANAGGVLCANTWFQLDGEWHYAGADAALYSDGVYNIGGTSYFFSYDGRMAKNEIITISSAAGEQQIYYVDNSGYVTLMKNNDWTQIGEKWFYVRDYNMLYGIQEIGGVLYGFSGDGMYEDEFFELYSNEEGTWMRYYAQENGALARNEWILIDGRWYCFDENGVAYENGLYQVGTNLYYFDYEGRAYQNQVARIGGKIYVCDDDCIATEVNGWFRDPANGKWMYAKDDGSTYSEYVYNIDGVLWAFDWNGYLCENALCSDPAWENQYLSDAEGKVITQIGWQEYNANYVYVTEGGALHEGWLFDIYYMTPYMEYCNLRILNGKLYAFNTKGEYSAITTPGFYSCTYNYDYYGDPSVCYVDGTGSVVTEDWAWISNNWYYFNSYGEMCTGYCTVNGVLYYFDRDGIMSCNGWGRDGAGDWYWADSDGKLFVGVDSTGYVFNENGWLSENETVYVNGTWYVTDGEGKARAILQEGWNEVGSDWYLIVDGELQTGRYTAEDGRIFCFNWDGKLYTNTFVDGSYYVNDNGELQTGWLYLDGKWYYGDQHSGWLYYSGLYYINGKLYFFKDRVLQQNLTQVCWDTDEIITTDSEGVVIARVAANGWAYEVSDTQGCVYYYQDGKPYTGWLGDYYISFGRLYMNTVVYDNDKCYYVGANGLCVYNGWYETSYEEWVYARADGSLYCDEWLQLGDTWYYFSDVYMAYGRTYEIDGKLHLFNEKGVWMYALDGSYEDGWNQVDGKWMFYMAGEPVCYTEICDNGAWYYLDYNGFMVTDYFENSYYYGSDGSRVNYIGWQFIDGNWVWFDQQHRVSVGWIYDGSNYYYQTYGYDRGENRDSFGIKTGYVSIDGDLCYFGANGAYQFTVRDNGWHYLDGCWYYLENGKYVTGTQIINNVEYEFDYYGVMLANDTYEGYYYNANGVKVTASGWYLLGEDWIYVADNGRVVYSGIVLIGGVEYCFESGRLVG